MQISDARKLKALEDENRKLKRTPGGLDVSTLKEILGKLLTPSSRRDRPTEELAAGDQSNPWSSPDGQVTRETLDGPIWSGFPRDQEIARRKFFDC